MDFDIDRGAPVKGRAEAFMPVPPHIVFHVLSDIARWPNWNKAVIRMEVGYKVGAGTEFHWHSGAMPVHSRIERFDPAHDLGWTNHSPWLDARHTWHLEAENGGTRVVTEESFSGSLPRLFPAMMKRMLDKALAQGLTALAKECEQLPFQTSTA